MANKIYVWNNLDRNLGALGKVCLSEEAKRVVSGTTTINYRGIVAVKYPYVNEQLIKFISGIGGENFNDVIIWKSTLQAISKLLRNKEMDNFHDIILLIIIHINKEYSFRLKILNDASDKTKYALRSYQDDENLLRTILEKYAEGHHNISANNTKLEKISFIFTDGKSLIMKNSNIIADIIDCIWKSYDFETEGISIDLKRNILDYKRNKSKELWMLFSQNRELYGLTSDRSVERFIAEILELAGVELGSTEGDVVGNWIAR